MIWIAGWVVCSVIAERVVESYFLEGFDLERRDRRFAWALGIVGGPFALGAISILKLAKLVSRISWVKDGNEIVRRKVNR